MCNCLEKIVAKIVKNFNGENIFFRHENLKLFLLCYCHLVTFLCFCYFIENDFRYKSWFWDWLLMACNLWMLQFQSQHFCSRTTNITAFIYMCFLYLLVYEHWNCCIVLVYFFAFSSFLISNQPWMRKLEISSTLNR